MLRAGPPRICVLDMDTVCVQHGPRIMARRLISRMSVGWACMWKAQAAGAGRVCVSDVWGLECWVVVGDGGCVEECRRPGGK